MVRRTIDAKHVCFLALVFVVFFISGCAPVEYDPNYNLDPDYVLKAAGYNTTEYIQRLAQSTPTGSEGSADALLALARLENKTDYYLYACNYFESTVPHTDEELAILLETRASLNCNSKRLILLKEAASIWKDLGVGWRAELLNGIVSNTTNPQFETSVLQPKIEAIRSDTISIGDTAIEIGKDAKVITQVDRVYRDWLGSQLTQSPFRGEILVTFSERLTYNESQLRSDIGWHEGGRMRDLKNNLGIDPTTAVGTIVARNEEGRWYASDENGVFRFEVPLDKISYPTTRFLTEDIAMIVDTHGLNMLVEQAIRKKATHVLSDCDHEGKTKAAVYLSERNISVICFPDRFAYHAIGHDAKFVSSPVWRFDDDQQKMIYGDNPITLERNQKIIVTNATIGKTYAVWYYTTPTFYFDIVNQMFPLDITTVAVDEYDQLESVFEKARQEGADVIATRIFRMADRESAQRWLNESSDHHLIVFHTTMYPAGILLMQEFPDQVHNADANIN